MEYIPGEEIHVPDPSTQGKEGVDSSFKRAVMTNERIELVANTLMEPNNMFQFGLVLKTTKGGHSAKGSGPVYKSFQDFINKQNHPAMSGCQVGEDALKSWIKKIKDLAAEEATRRASLGERGRVGTDDKPENVLRHVEASFQLMEYFKEHERKFFKDDDNLMNSRLEGYEEIEPVKDGGDFIQIRKDSQSEEINVVKDRNKRKLVEESLMEDKASKTAGKAITRPKIIPDPLSVADFMVDAVKGFMTADSISRAQQALKLYHDTRMAKLEEIKVVNEIMATASSQEVKDALQKHILEVLEQLSQMKVPYVAEGLQADVGAEVLHPKAHGQLTPHSTTAPVPNSALPVAAGIQVPKPIAATTLTMAAETLAAMAAAAARSPAAAAARSPAAAAGPR